LCGFKGRFILLKRTAHDFDTLFAKGISKLPSKIHHAIAIHRQNSNARFHGDGAIPPRLPVRLKNLVFMDIDKRVVVLRTPFLYCPRAMFLCHDMLPYYELAKVPLLDWIEQSLSHSKGIFTARRTAYVLGRG
jgi:hypothetical protein